MKAYFLKTTSITLSLFLSLVLFSCTERKNFNCPAQKGKACLTIAESDGAPSNKKIEKLKKIKPIKGEVIEQVPTESFTTSRLVPERTEEKIGKVWLAPTLDEDGSFYDESFVYIILTPSVWKIKSR